MLNYIRNKINAYITDIVAQCVEMAVKRLEFSNDRMDDIAARTANTLRGEMAEELAERFTAEDIAAAIDKRGIARCLDMDEIKQHCAEAIDCEELAGHFNVSDIAAELDLSDIAKEADIDYAEMVGHLDYQELAGEIDKSDIASEVSVDAEEVAEHLDYRLLARELLNAVKGGA